MPIKVEAKVVQAACPYCSGKVLRGYKHAADYQKCYKCHRVSWKNASVAFYPTESNSTVAKPIQGALL